MATYIKIASNTVGAGGAASVTFSSIPSTYTDLVLKISWRTTAAVVANIGYLTFNSDTTGYSHKFVQGNGATADSGGYTGANSKNSGIIPGSSATGNTFSNNEIYIPNYKGSNYKSYSIDSTGENNATTSYAMLLAGLWSNISAITSIKLEEQNGATISQYSTFTLYGVSNA